MDKTPGLRNRKKYTHNILAGYLFFFLVFAANAQTERLRYAVIPENPRPGEPVTVAVNGGDGIHHAALWARGLRLSRANFFPMPVDGENLMAAVLAVPATAEPGTAMLNIEGRNGIAAVISLNIERRDFLSEIIELNPVLTGIRTDPDPQKTAESQLLWAIISRTNSDIYCSGIFSPPVTSTRRTSFFGDRRIFKYSNGKSDTSIHAGVDYGVPTGTVVMACGPGKVVLARSRIVTGNSVIIEHLPGVYSLYYHLDKIEVAENAVVTTGTVLGQSGATGLATGPHLHWEIRVSGENTDPDAFIARPILDKDAIFTKINKTY